MNTLLPSTQWIPIRTVRASALTFADRVVGSMGGYSVRSVGCFSTVLGQLQFAAFYDSTIWWPDQSGGRLMTIISTEDPGAAATATGVETLVEATKLHQNHTLKIGALATCDWPVGTGVQGVQHDYLLLKGKQNLIGRNSCGAVANDVLSIVCLKIRKPAQVANQTGDQHRVLAVSAAALCAERTS